MISMLINESHYCITHIGRHIIMKWEQPTHCDTTTNNTNDIINEGLKTIVNMSQLLRQGFEKATQK